MTKLLYVRMQYKPSRVCCYYYWLVNKVCVLMCILIFNKCSAICLFISILVPYAATSCSGDCRLLHFHLCCMLKLRYMQPSHKTYIITSSNLTQANFTIAMLAAMLCQYHSSTSRCANNASLLSLFTHCTTTMQAIVMQQHWSYC
jgi:hypothetical protein